MIHDKVQKRTVVKVLRAVGWIAVSFISMMFLVILLIRIPYVQNQLVQKAILFLENKIGTEVSLKSLYVEFPKKIVLEGLYLEDQNSDTLLYAAKLSVDTDLLNLIKHKIQLNTVRITNSVVGIRRSESDSTFNFDYIIKALAGDTVASDTTQSAWGFSIGSTQLSKAAVSFHDLYSGNKLEIKVRNLDIRMDEFNPSKSIYKISSVEIANAYANLTQSKRATAEPSNQTSNTKALFPLDIDFKKIHIKNVNLRYSQVADGRNINIHLGDFIVAANKIDLNSHTINLERIQLNQSFISYHAIKVANEKSPPSSGSGNPTFDTDIGWKINLNQLSLADNGFQYYNFNAPANHEGLDVNHLWVFALHASADDIEIDEGNIRADLQNLSLKEKNGFSIESLASQVRLTHTNLDLSDFSFKSENSELALNASASFPSPAAALANYSQVKFKLDIANSFIALRDVLFFAPSITDSFLVGLPKNTKLFVDTKLRGSVSDLLIDNLSLRTLDSTNVSMTGKLTGLPDIDHTFMNVKVKRFYTTNSDIDRILPDSTLPSSIKVPRWLEMHGNFRGTMHTPEIEASLETSIGSLDMSGKFDLTSVGVYDAEISTKKFNVGELIKQEEIGALSMQVAVKGSGLTMKNLDATVDATVSQFLYEKYDYRDFKLEGSLKNYFFSGTASLSDKNLDFVLQADLDYQNDIPVYKLSFDLKNADLMELHLSQLPLKARATVEVDVATHDFKSINGKVSIRKVAIYNGAALYKVDSLLCASIDQEGESNISIRSDILSGDFKGTFNLLSLPKTIKQHINQYFSLHDVAITKFTEPQKFEFSLILKNTDLLTEIIFPDLEPFVPGKIQGEFDSELNVLNLEIGLARMKYASAAVDSISLKVNSDEAALSYKLSLKNVRFDTLLIDALYVTGKVAHDSIQTALIVMDSLADEKYLLGGIISSLDNGFRFHFNPDQVILNYQKWEVPIDNYVQLGNNLVQTNNFSLSQEEEKVAVLTSADSSVMFLFERFQIANLTKIIAGMVPASGELNGDLKFTTLDKGEFNSKLKISKLVILDKTWGNALVSIDHTAATYNLNLSIEGDSVNVQSTGEYNTESLMPEFKINVEVSPFNLALLEPLSFGQLKGVKGLMVGSLLLTGSRDKPSIRGKLSFNNAVFISTYLNNSFSLQKENVSFQESGIVFSNFKMRDEKDNVAEVKGAILTEAYKKFDFDLRIIAKEFQLLNSRKNDNELYYGLLKVNTNATITGDSNEPKIEMTASLSDDSEITYVVPQVEKNILEQKGIVQFIDRDAVIDPFLTNLQLQDTTYGVFGGLNLSANIEFNDKAVLNIIIDPLTGDKLSVRGNSTLVLDMNASGNVNLSGRYEITKGSYNFTFYNLVKREFMIEKGGSITWSGDPLNAALDIRASYQVETSPLDLVYNQINTANQTEVNAYNQRLPFLVYLNIKGKLLVPELSFAIDMPDDKRNVLGGAIYAKLQDINTRESDLNKQVFALLILKRFIAENPFESQATSSISNTTRVSVSRLLSEQLNRLSEKVRGVQLSFDLKSYENYSGEEVQGQTKVQLGVSKNLFNNRLMVKLSGNVDIEGEVATEGDVSDYIGDLALEYKLTNDGRFRLTGFRNSNYDMIDGELTETGAGLLYIKDYNTLRELFMSNATAN